MAHQFEGDERAMLPRSNKKIDYNYHWYNEDNLVEEIEARIDVGILITLG